MKTSPSLIQNCREYVRALLTSRGQDQSQLQRNIGDDLLEWPQRIILAKELLDKHVAEKEVTVADYGCGRQTLRRFIPSSWLYTPFDYCTRTPDTVVCDFNSKLPVGRFDLIFCLGVFEYLDDPYALIVHALKNCRHLVFSYNGPTIPERRVIQGWKNELQFSEIEAFIGSNNSEILDMVLMDNNERIYLIRSGIQS